MNRVVWSVVVVHILIYFAIALLCSCGLFKKTTKEQHSLKQENTRAIEMNQLDLSKLYRETERYSFHPDGSIAAHELEREQIAAASLNKLKQQVAQKTEIKEMKKTSSPARLWILAGILVVLCCIYYLKMK